MPRFKALFILVLPILFFSLHSTPAWALKILEGKEADAYIGDVKTHFVSGSYTYEFFKRSHRDAHNARQSDAIIFFGSGNRIHYVKRTDGLIEMLVNHPEGREENPVSDDALVWGPIQNTLNDDHPNAHVILDDAGKELAVVYLGKKTQLIAKMDGDYLRIRIQVRNSSERNSGKAR